MTKIKAELKGEGCIAKRVNSIHGFTGLRMIPKVVVEGSDNGDLNWLGTSKHR